jgi:putative Mg2+ transporter-C (MgtC) family protein
VAVVSVEASEEVLEVLEIEAALRSELSDLPSLTELVRLLTRLLIAGVLGGAMGFERERNGKAAGLRTHVLVAMGSAFFVAVPRLAGMEEEAVSRVLQGLITGIGFLGAGSILKHEQEGRIEGLTTAASVWFAAAVGIACGLGRGVTAVVGTAMNLAILCLVPHVSAWSKRTAPTDQSSPLLDLSAQAPPRELPKNRQSA